MAGDVVPPPPGLVVVYFIGSSFNARSQTLLLAAIICGTLCLGAGSIWALDRAELQVFSPQFVSLENLYIYIYIIW